MNLAEIRQKYPQYSDMPDGDLAQRLHSKFYADIPFEEFSKKIGYEPVKEATQPSWVGEQAGGALETAQNIGRVYPALEAGASWLTNLYGLPASGLAALAGLPFGKEQEWAEKTREALIYQPQTERGQQLMGRTMLPFEKLQEAAEYAGGKTLEKTGSPALATGVHTAIEAAPVLVPFGPKFVKGIRNKIVNSTTWRKASIPERNLIIQDLDDVLNNPQSIKKGVTEADIVRKYGGKYFEQALERRIKGESRHTFADIIEEVEPTGPPPVPGMWQGEPRAEMMPSKEFATTPVRGPIPQPRKPMAGPGGGWVEGAGEIKKPYPGQKAIPVPIPKLGPPPEAPVPSGPPIPMTQGIGSQVPFPEGFTQAGAPPPEEIAKALETERETAAAEEFEKAKVKEKPEKFSKQWLMRTFKGDVYNQTGDFLGSVYLDGEEAHLLKIDDGKVVEKLGVYKPTDFEKAGKLQLSARQSVQEWKLKQPPRIEKGEVRKAAAFSPDTLLKAATEIDPELVHVGVKELRKKFPDVSKDEFDKAVLNLRDKGEVWLQRSAASPKVAEKMGQEVVVEGEDTYSSLSKRKPTPREAKGKEPWEKAEIRAEQIDDAEKIAKALIKDKISRNKAFDRYVAQQLGRPDLTEGEFLEIYDRYKAEYPDLKPVKEEKAHILAPDTVEGVEGNILWEDKNGVVYESSKLGSKHHGDIPEGVRLKIEDVARRGFISEGKETWLEKPIPLPKKKPVPLKKSEKAKPKRVTARDYLEEKVVAGGIETTRGQLIKELQAQGANRQQIDMYLMGLETGKEAREKAKPEKAKGKKAEKLPEGAELVARHMKKPEYKGDSEIVTEYYVTKAPSGKYEMYRRRYKDQEKVSEDLLTQEWTKEKAATSSETVFLNAEKFNIGKELQKQKDAEEEFNKQEYKLRSELQDLIDKGTEEYHKELKKARIYGKAEKGEAPQEKIDAIAAKLKPKWEPQIEVKRAELKEFRKGKKKFIADFLKPPSKPSTEPQKFGEPDRAIGRAYIKDRWRPIVGQREIKKGKNKGKLEVRLPDGKKAIVEKDAIREMWKPEETGKKSLKQLSKKYLGSEEGMVDLGEILDVLKKAQINLPKDDIGVLQQFLRIPDWLTESHPKELKFVRENLKKRDLHRNLLRHDLMGAVKPFLDLKGKSFEKVAEALIKGDQIGATLPDKVLKKKFTPEEANAYRAVREVLNYIWFEDLPQLMKDLGHKESEIQEKMKQYGKLGAYFPRRRIGRYFIKATRKEVTEDPETFVLWREHFDDIILTATRGKIGIKSAFKKKKLEDMFPDAIIEGPKEVTRYPESMYFEVSPAVTQELLDYAMKHVEGTKAEKNAFKKAMEQAVADVFKVRGFMEHAKGRKGIPGYELAPKYAKETLINYINGYAGFKSKMLAARELWHEWPKVKWEGKPGLRTWADNYVKDTYSNMDRLDLAVDKARGIFFYQFLGAVIKSAMLNATQNFISATPMLSTETGWAGTKVSAEMVKTMGDIVRQTWTKKPKTTGIDWPMSKRETATSKRLSPEEQRAITRARLDGTVADKLTEELMGIAFGKYGGYFRKLQSGMRFMFGSVERMMNREPTFMVAFRVAKKKGMGFEEAYTFAQRMVEKSHYNYGKTNLPKLVRGENLKALRPAWTFRTYTANLVEEMGYLWNLAEREQMKAGQKPSIPVGKEKFTRNVKGKMALARMFAALLAFGGLAGIPLFNDLMDFIAKRTGEDPRSKIAEIAGDWADMVFYGGPGLVGVDLTGSISIEVPRSAAELIGIPYEYAKRTKNFMDDIYVQDWQRAAEDFPLTPQFAKYPIQAYRYATEGFKTRTGVDIVDDDFQPIKLTQWEAMRKAAGFQPTRISEHWRKERTRAITKKYWEDRKTRLLTAHRNALSAGDYQKLAEIGGKIQDLNSQLPPEVAPINIRTIKTGMKPIKSKREAIGRKRIK